ncbi:MAG: hypothetical protein ACI9KE_002205 [Polyangiales bacterium]|jgi:hypothetical protein
MNSLSKKSLGELLAPREGPCVSLYQPTHRLHPENVQDPIRFRNLIKELEATLGADFPNADAKVLLKPFEELAKDEGFWNGTLDGLAVLAAPGFFRVFRLPRPVSKLVVVANTFHVKPMRRILQSAERYQVLALSLESARLFEGDRDTLEEIELTAGDLHTGTGAKITGPGSQGVYVGAGRTHDSVHNGVKSDESELDAIHFFRSVDEAVLTHHSRLTGLPLILAALPEHHHSFRDVSQNPLLLGEGIHVNPDSMTINALRATAWELIEPEYKARLASLKDDFKQAEASGQGSDSVREITSAAASGRVATLFITADGQAKIDPNQKNENVQDIERADDEFDGLSALVGKMGGDVLVIPAASMPSHTGVAAIYRY